MWGKRSDMIIHDADPFNAEPPPQALAAEAITPVDVFYSRNHGTIPDIGAQDWQLSVGGRVARPHVFTLDEIRQRFARATVIATMQCAGNRRAGLIAVRSIPGEDPWGSGAVSTAEWCGVRLADILDDVGAEDADGLHVAFDGPDVSYLANPPQNYGSSIDIVKARSPEVLLAWSMNGQPLPRVHGGPVRVVVPGYIGARSVKWVTAITVGDAPTDNYFQASAYRIVAPDIDPETIAPGDGISLSTLALNSDILSHRDGDQVPAGALTLVGYAQAADGRRVARVDVSTDDGITWGQADINLPAGRWAWCRWTYTVQCHPGRLAVAVRAFDDTAATQPESAAALWNPKGYLNNSWARITLNVT
ncbi:sulfite oxidase [Mycolicibacterium pallens]|uniref:Sulfite oxidase n=1 Tax=Mycolicibacterium pallens TaxID=370524 RepID=A0ABX8VM17_9MYCO|nr:sulfite oxidase [Mycolicibacterium pallens]QYL18820.1 sulfite oxidase [Mycolicibacterium pallens]